MNLFRITGYEEPEELTDIAAAILAQMKHEPHIVVPARDKSAARLLTQYLATADTTCAIRSITIMESCAVILANDRTQLPFDLEIIDHVKRNQ